MLNLQKALKLLLIAFICFLNLQTQAQPWNDLVKDLPPGTNFKTVQGIVNQYYNNRSHERGSGYKQWKREEWWSRRHLDASETVVDWMDKLREEQRNYKTAQRTTQPLTPGTHALWSSFGPTSIANGNDDVGRVVCMAFHPTNANQWYIGTPAGGLWRTTNNGGSYTSLTDGFPGLGVASIVIHPTTPTTMYILTGDGNASHRGHYLKEAGTGIYKTIDGGDTWTETGMILAYSAATYGYKLMMHPNSTSTLLAATSTGFWRSFNSGTTWTPSASLAGTEITDFEFKPGSA
ncbi:MAG: hypothetical protein ABIQ56_01920, partial [Chitinophagaceae bacterium]